MTTTRSWRSLAIILAILSPCAPRAARADELAPDAAATLELGTVTAGLVLPTAIDFLPNGDLVIAEKEGRVLVRKASGELVVAGQLDVDSKTEKGLLNVIHHPAFAENRELVFFYSAAKAPELDKHKIARIRLGTDDHLELSTEKVLVSGLRGPDEHEMGGGLAIDRSGNLLVGVGDTGCRARKLPEPPYTPTNYFGTCLTNGNGKILRIALDGSIPADNPLTTLKAVTACGDRCGDDPFARTLAEPRRDIWAWGLRNPWRIWVDPKTGNVWVGDVGDIGNEEIDVIPPRGGAHLGWPFREGGQGHPVNVCQKTTPNTGDCLEPAYSCRHDDAPGPGDAGCKSMNGGFILDDCRWPAPYRGKYFFGDNANGRLWTLTPTPGRESIVPGSRRDLGQLDGFVVDLDPGPDGAIYAAVMRIPPEESKVIRIAPRVMGSCNEDAAAAAKAAPPRPVEPVRQHRPGRKLAALAIAVLALVAAVVLVATESRKA